MSDLFHICRLAMLLLFFPVAVWAQENPRIQRYSVEDGLSQAAVTCLAQDAIGYLWIGTRDGLNRYDGTTFKIFRHNEEDSTTIGNNLIVDMVVDSSSRLWIATQKAISLYVPLTETFINFRLPDSSALGVTILDLQYVAPHQFFVSTDRGLLLFEESSHQFIVPQGYDRYFGKYINRIDYHPNLGLIMLTPEGVVDGKHKLLHRWEHPELSYSGRIKVASNGDFYFSWDNSLFCYRYSDSSTRLLYQFKGTWPIEGIEPNSGELLISRDKLIKLDTAGHLLNEIGHSPWDPYSLSGDYTTCSYSTRDGNIWIGTNGFGLNKIDRSLSRFGYLGSVPGSPCSLSEPFVNSIFTADDTTIYVSTGRKGYDLINLHEETTKRIPVSALGSDAHISSIFVDEDGHQWLGTINGLYKGFHNRDFISITTFNNWAISSIQHAGTHQIMVNSNNGIFILNTITNAIVFQKVFDRPTRDTYAALMEGDHFWESSSGAIRLLDRQGNFGPSYSLRGSDASGGIARGIKCIFKDSQQRLWIGSWGGGLSLLDTLHNEFTSYTTKEGLSNDVVYGILEDKRGMLWMSTNKGISRFNPTTGGFNTYSAKDGLQGDEFNTNAYFISPHGKMYFGGTNGLTTFFPSIVTSFEIGDPVLRLNNFFVNELPASLRRNDPSPSLIQSLGEVTLGADTRSFAFDISSIAFTSPHKVRYRYKLEPFQSEWIELGIRTYINFTNIPSGDYLLSVNATSLNGEWSPGEMHIKVTVLSPLWEKPWFITFVALMVVATAYGGYQYRVRRYRMQTIQLEGLVTSRTKELQIKKEEIETQNEELVSQADQLATQNEELNDLKKELEKKVDTRTYELQLMNADLLSKNTQLEQFAFIIAHNLNGPMARIKGLLTLLSDGHTEKDIIGSLEVSADDLNNVIKDLSNILNLVYGVKTKLEHLGLRDQISQTLKTLEEDISRTRAGIHLNVSPEIHVFGIKPYLHSIFYNLIQNALKYARTHEPLQVNIDAVVEGDKVIVTIKDNGVGIDMRYAKDKLFKLYQRFHTQVPGKGLGLYLVKTQIEILSGSIEVSSEMMKGTTFTLKFIRAD